MREDRTYGAFLSGEINVTDSAVQLTALAVRWVMFKAATGNTGTVYIGGPGVTVPDGTADTTSGWPLAAGEETGWIPIENLNLLYVIAGTSGDDLSYLALA